MNKRIVIDDNIIVKDQVCAAASKMLYNFCPPFQAEAIDRLLAKGYQLTGRSNIGEFGMAGTETSVNGPTVNPLNADFLGSAAAAAVLNGQADAALIVDQGDSLRLAAQSGCVAYRPTYGMVSRFGVIANISSSEQIGAVAGSVEAAAAVVQDVAGHDAKDATSLPDASYELPVQPYVQGMKVALVENLLSDATNPAARQAAADAAEALKAMGCQVDRVSLPYLELAGPAYICMAAAEGCNNVSRFDGVKYGYRAEKYRNIEDLYRASRSEGFGYWAKFQAMLGMLVLSKGNYEKYYYKALQARRLIRDAFKELFRSYDAAIMPLACGGAYAKDAENIAELRDDDRCWSAPALIAGLPTVALPWGKNAQGLPFALQIIAESKLDENALAVAASLEGGQE